MSGAPPGDERPLVTEPVDPGAGHYRRPTVPARRFEDEQGRLIRYGDRWGAAGPPEESYSVLRNAERFQPLHAVATALIEHLGERYSIEQREDPDLEEHWRSRGAEVLGSTVLVPVGGDGAPLSFLATGLPGLIVGAGRFYQELFPRCGCEACDEEWEGCADDLERLVFAVAEGRFTEKVIGGRQPVSIEYRIDDPSHGSISGFLGIEDFPAERVEEGRRASRGGDGVWPAWLLRRAADGRR